MKQWLRGVLSVDDWDYDGPEETLRRTVQLHTAVLESTVQSQCWLAAVC